MSVKTPLLYVLRNGYKTVKYLQRPTDLVFIEQRTTCMCVHFARIVAASKRRIHNPISAGWRGRRMRIFSIDKPRKKPISLRSNVISSNVPVRLDYRFDFVHSYEQFVPCLSPPTPAHSLPSSIVCRAKQ